MTTGPLSGVTVLDLTHYLAGPFATQLLGDLGARIIKVENPSGDITRFIPPYFVGEDSAYFLSANRNKESVTLNLKIDGDRQAFLRMVPQADLVVESNRPGVMDRLGLGFGRLVALNPRVVMVSITGFGQDGPTADRPAYDAIVQALSGVMSLTGEPGGMPVRTGVPLGDLAGALYGVIGGLAAMLEARATGRGRHVDVSMLDSQIALLSYLGVYYLVSGEVPALQGRGHVSVPTYRAFACGDGVEVMICANTEKQWAALCDALGETQLPGDPRFAVLADRNAHRQELWDIIEPLFLTRSSSEWLPILWEHDVPAAPIRTIDQALEDPQVRHRRMLLRVDGHSQELIGNPVKIVGNDRARHTWPPKLGEHTQRVLAELAAAGNGTSVVEDGYGVTGRVVPVAVRPSESVG